MSFSKPPSSSESTANNSASNNVDPLFDGSEDIDDLILSFLPESDRAALEKEAAAFVGKSLLLHDDLESRALDLLMEVNRDRDEAIMALRNTTGEQLVAVRKGIERFNKAEKAMQDLAASFAEMDRLVSTMQSVSSYHQIRQLHYYHENLANMVKWTECFAAFDPSSDVGSIELENVLRGGKLGNPVEKEALMTAKNFAEVYSSIRVMQSIRARLAIPQVANENRISINVVKKHLDEGERILELFLTTCLDIIRRAPDVCVEYVLTYETPADKQERKTAIRERDLLFEVIKIANQESREPALYESVEIAAYHLQLSLQRMAGRGGEVARPDTQINSLLSWAMISRHLDSGVRSFFLETICVGDDDRKGLSVEVLLGDVTATCDAIDNQVEPYSECIEKALTDPLAPIGPINLLPHIMKKLNYEVCNLIEEEYCDPGAEIDVNALLRCLELTITYKENCLIKGTIGQFVPPSAMESISTKVLEVAVSGMRDYLATNARNCTLRVLDSDVKHNESDGSYSTSGPGDMVFIITSMLKAVTKDASSDVRSKMSTACATALRYYVDRFCEKLRFGPDYFEGWYIKISPPGVNMGDRWALWICAAINDFTELQRNVGKLDASLFDLQHQAVSTNDGGKGNANDGKNNNNNKGATGNNNNTTGDIGSPSSTGAASSTKSSLSPLQTFASILGKQVFTKLISQIGDYLEIKVLPGHLLKVFEPANFLPTTVASSALLNETVDEIRAYLNSLQHAILPPWNNVASSSLVVRVIFVYATRLLTLIYNNLDGKTTRASLKAKLVDDLRIWTALCSELLPIQEDLLRFEDKNDPDVMPDVPGALGCLRVILRLATVDSVDTFKVALREDVAYFTDIPDWLYDIMIDNNKAHNDLASSVKSGMKKLWKEHMEKQAKYRLMCEQNLLSRKRGFHDENTDDDDHNHGKDDGDDHQKQGGSLEEFLFRGTPGKSLFGSLPKDQIIPKKTGFFSKARDDGLKEVGATLGHVKICFEQIVIREAATPTGFQQKSDVVVCSLEDLMAGRVAGTNNAKK